ncbi:Rrf2 family transcriptional regulator [Mycoplasmopsis verecunda]|uniref:DNA-binding transcriptional regulator, IscR family n=1 Tax=Mycoplasmopsis verecunda TaxID=171291 RepID=A0A1T4L6D6_9BACT|nr:Rrf2 family transcriptional regulator [Mycoplasmopsis verecunda]WPB54782.1 Rrf2 family transcriptional regulator [Mycoplasmopsis verecunda]SJZ50272.1 DNA-binding transcriptional regulator, IscR family [Mycoplasmopsis verecunda]
MKNITYKNTNTKTKHCFSDFISLIHILTILGHKKQAMSSAEIGKNVDINPVKVREILRTLDETNWIKKTRGRDGGYQLAVNLSEIKLSKLLDLLNLNLINNSWFSGMQNSNCIISKNIQAVEQELITSLNNLIYLELSRKNLAQFESEILKKGQANE